MAQYRLAHAAEIEALEAPIVTVTEISRDSDGGTFNINVAAPDLDLGSIDPCLGITRTSLERQENRTADIWEEVARRTGGRAISPARLREIADSLIAEGWTP